MPKLCGRETFGFECGVRDKTTHLNILCVYRNDDKFYLDKFLEQLELLLEHFFNKKCIVAGDFNVNLLQANEQRTKFMSLLQRYNFRTLISSATYSSGNALSCLDNFITNLPDEYIQDSKVVFNGLSDGHAGLFCHLIFPNIQKSDVTDKYLMVKRRIFSDRNNDTFRKCIVAINWHNLGINSFLKVFYDIFKKSFPMKKAKIKINKEKGLKWITKGIRISSHSK